MASVFSNEWIMFVAGFAMTTGLIYSVSACLALIPVRKVSYHFRVSFFVPYSSMGLAALFIQSDLLPDLQAVSLFGAVGAIVMIASFLISARSINFGALSGIGRVKVVGFGVIATLSLLWTIYDLDENDTPLVVSLFLFQLPVISYFVVWWIVSWVCDGFSNQTDIPQSDQKF